MMRHTKIIATVGPASDTPETLEALIAAGVNVFRLNFSHGTHETHGEAFRRIREAARQRRAARRHHAGPERTEDSHRPPPGGRPIPLRPGDELRIAEGDEAGAARSRVHAISPN